MKTAKTILSFLLLVLCLGVSYGQDVDIKPADQYKKIADQFNFNRKKDSSVVYYQKAAQIYLNNYINKKDRRSLKDYIHCKCNYAYNVSLIGEIDEACNVAEKVLQLCEDNFEIKNEFWARAYLTKAFCYDMKQDFNSAINYYDKSLKLYEE